MSSARTAARPAAETLPVQSVFDRYLAAWAARDPALIASLHSDDTSFWMHDGTARVFGRKAVEQHFAGIFARFPGFAFDVYRSLIADRHWVLDWAMKAEMTGKGGKQVQVRIDMLDVVDINEAGEVVRKDTFYDASQAQAAMAALSA
jgi:uncharacterized protein (TIGR02246 family)